MTISCHVWTEKRSFPSLQPPPLHCSLFFLLITATGERTRVIVKPLVLRQSVHINWLACFCLDILTSVLVSQYFTQMSQLDWCIEKLSFTRAHRNAKAVHCKATRTHTLKREGYGETASGRGEWQVINWTNETCIQALLLWPASARSRQQCYHILHRSAILGPSGDCMRVYVSVFVRYCGWIFVCVP